MKCWQMPTCADVNVSVSSSSVISRDCLALTLCHFPVHAKRRRRRSRYHPARLSWVRRSIRLRELEGREVLCGLICGEGVWIRLEVLPVRRQLQRDDERRKEVVRILATAGGRGA